MPFRPQQHLFYTKGSATTIATNDVGKRIRYRVFNANSVGGEQAIILNTSNYVYIENNIFKNYPSVDESNKGQAISAIGTSGNRKNLQNLSIKNNFFKNVTECVELLHVNFNNIKVEKNKVIELSPYLRNGNVGDWRAGFFQLANADELNASSSGVDVKRNRVWKINKASGDIFNIFNAYGISTAKITLANNICKGEPLLPLGLQTYGKACYVLGDDGGDYIDFRHNVGIAACTFGVQAVGEAPGLTNFTAENNIMYSPQRSGADETGSGFQLSTFDITAIVKNNHTQWTNFSGNDSSSTIQSSGVGYTEHGAEIIKNQNKFGSSTLTTLGYNIVPSNKIFF